eukprot:6185949-Pleurochrysis_carterae.AAC.1
MAFAAFKSTAIATTTTITAAAFTSSSSSATTNATVNAKTRPPIARADDDIVSHELPAAAAIDARRRSEPRVVEKDTADAAAVLEQHLIARAFEQ